MYAGVNRSLQHRLVFASVALGVLVGAAFVTLIVTLHNARGQERARARSERLIASASRLEQLVLDLEGDARRYVITHDSPSFAPLVNARRRFDAESLRLVELSRGDPVREARARQLRAGVNHFGRAWAQIVLRGIGRDPTRARDLVLGSTGLREQDTLLAQFNALESAEQAQSDAARARAGRSEHYAIESGTAGLVGSLALIALFALYVSQRIVQPIRRVAAATQRFAAGHLDERVPGGGADEIGDLTRNFNVMAESIEHQQLELANQNRSLEHIATELQTVLDSTIDGIALTDLGGDVQLANRPMRQLAVELGMQDGRNVVDQLLSIKDKVGDPERFVETMERLRLHPHDVSADEFELADASRAFVGYTAPVTGGGQTIARIWTFREVTQQRELDRLKDEFIATVSHELRTPLTSMMGFIEMLREGEGGDLSSEQERFLSIVHRSSERLHRLVGDLLFVARLDAAGMRLELEDGVALDEVVSDCIEAAGAEARAREVELRFEPNGPVKVRGDRTRIDQLVTNLVSNAVKFTASGGHVVARVSAENEHAVIEVEDNGIGIPAAEQDRVFQRFFRASTATDQAVPGTGLGLAITKAITEAHHGRISLRSRPGEGTCFRVELPL
jgi:signal transduction histidine kinase/HAMP domain-containing protein